ncbi:MAG: hypothetical protein QUV05_18025 [Phycisphaerae bacterium]|nr:hypothetical protein [Phycisphaerae bacterium]
MITPDQSYTDFLIDEVRQRRQELLRQHDNDLDKLFEAVRAIDSEHPEKVRDHRRRRSNPPPAPR